MKNNLVIRQFGLQNYRESYLSMCTFTDKRNEKTVDECWCLEHYPVFTLGLAGKPEHIHNTGSIPVVRTDRGGQVTYHGPGQLVVYLLLDLKRKGMTVKPYVNRLEEIIIDVCKQMNIKASRKTGAPGVYVNDCKLAALGIRVRRGCSYHGLALNVDVDTTPFQMINPCGYSGMKVTCLQDLGCQLKTDQVFDILVPVLCDHLGYENTIFKSGNLNPVIGTQQAA